MVVKIAIIIFLFVLLFGCSGNGSVRKQMENESVTLTTMGNSVYRVRYMSNGMLYEVVYVKQVHIESTALEMAVINLTLDSIRTEQLKEAQNK